MLTGIKILAIDDQQEILLLFRLVLERYGAIVYTASSGNAGVRLAKENVPHVVLTDMNMHDGDGSYVISELAAEKSTAFIPIIVVSAVGAANLDLAASAILTKPILPSQLVNSIENVMAKTP